jgi:hypothetical protein
MMNRKIKTHHATRTVALTALALSLAACTTVFESDKVDYRAAKKAAPLDIPPDLTQLQKDNRYAVPDGRGVATASGFQQARGTPAIASRGRRRRSARSRPRPCTSNAPATSAGWWSSRPRNSCGRSCRPSGRASASRWKPRTSRPASWKPTGPRTAPRSRRTSSAAPSARCSIRPTRPASATSSAPAWSAVPTVRPRSTSATAAPRKSWSARKRKRRPGPCVRPIRASKPSSWAA